MLIATMTLQARRPQIMVAIRALHLRRVHRIVMIVRRILGLEVCVAAVKLALVGRFCAVGRVSPGHVPRQALLCPLLPTLVAVDLG